MTGIKKHRNNKYTYEEVYETFAKRGYTLLDKEYKNISTRMRYRCHKHPDKELYITFSDLNNGNKGCVYCAGLNKPTMEEVRENFNKLGLILLEDSYKNQRTKMRYICRKHPNEIQSKIYKTIKRGIGCRLCGYESASKKNSGKGNWNWGGGVSEIKHYLRKQIDEWKFESLEKYGFKCAITGEKADDLQVHHLTPFYVIRDEVMDDLGIEVRETIGEYSDEELSLLVAGIKRRHDEEKGVPLRYHIHRLFHSEYGNTTTAEDFAEFKRRYQSGEFDEIEAVV